MTEFELQVDKQIQAWHKQGATWPWQSVANKSWEDMYDEERQIVAELYWKVYQMPHWKEMLS